MTGTEAVTSPSDPTKKDEKTVAIEGGEDAAAASPKKAPAPPKPTVHKTNWEQDTVYLYQFPRVPTLPSVSAYCLKVENYLRMTGIKYENVAHGVSLLSSRGELPFVELNGAEINDTDHIIRELNTKFDKNLDSGLTPDQRIVSHAMESMLNNQTSWMVRVWRYRYPNEFIESSQIDLRKSLGSKLPLPLLNFMFRMGFKRNISGAYGRSVMSKSREEIVELLKSDLKVLSDFLGTKDYFFGKEPHLLDCSAFAHLAQLIYVPIGDVKTWMESDTPNLIALVDRIKTKWWPDWEEMTTSLELNTHLPKKELTPEEIEAQKKEEAKKAEEAKKKEEKQKEKEEKKKQKEEEKRKAKEEKERKKKEAAEAKAKAAAEKAEKEKAEKEKKEAEAKEKAEKEAAEKAEKEAADKVAAEAKAAEDAAAAAAAPAATATEAKESTEAK